MQRYNFYFRQKVKHNELDSAFDAVEDELSAFLNGFGYLGISQGADIVEHNPTANFTVDITGPALIYDQAGQKMAWTADQNVDMTVDEGSTATAVATSGNEKWLSIFAEYKRVLSDPRTDGNGATVYFDEAESFNLNVVQGVEAPSGTAVKPSVRSDQILLGDVLITYGMTEIENADINLDRAEYPYDLTGSPLSIHEKGLQDALQEMVDQINSYSATAPSTSDNNVFTGTNTFNNDVTFNDDVSFGAASTPVFSSIPEFADDATFDENIVFDENASPTIPRILLDMDIKGSLPTGKVLIMQWSNTASLARNIRIYAYDNGYIITLGAYWNGTGWAYDTSISTAYALRLEGSGTVGVGWLYHSGSSPWIDSAWTQRLVHDFDEGIILGQDTGTYLDQAGGIQYIENNKTYIYTITYPAFQPGFDSSGVAQWYQASAEGMRSRDNAKSLWIPIRHPAYGTSGAVTVQVLLKPGTASGSRTSGMQALLYKFGITDWSSPEAPSTGSAVDSDFDDGTTDWQLITLSGIVGATNVRGLYLAVVSGDDGGAHVYDIVSAVRVSVELSRLPLAFNS